MAATPGGLPPIAITGGTGFVGARVLALAGQPVRALTRREQPPMPGIEWIAGDLADKAALARLCDGAGAVLHIAGVTNARDRAGFWRGNIDGTTAMVKAATAAGVARFVQVSSLAAREPRKSVYGGSKAQADTAVMNSKLDWVIVRPPGVYGPGDAEMVGLYKLAQRGYAVAPAGRISLLHVDDLARALLALVDGGPAREIVEIDDGAGDAHDGYTHMDLARAIGVALDKPLKPVLVPTGMLGLAASVMALVSRAPKLTRDRAKYLAHPDWVARAGNARLDGMWAPRVSLAEGIADTVAGYRARGWICAAAAGKRR